MGREWGIRGFNTITDAWALHRSWQNQKQRPPRLRWSSERAYRWGASSRPITASLPNAPRARDDTACLRRSLWKHVSILDSGQHRRQFSVNAFSLLSATPPTWKR